MLMNFAHNTIRKKNTEDIILMNFAHNFDIKRYFQ